MDVAAEQGDSTEAKPLLQKVRRARIAVYGPDHESVRRVDGLLTEIASLQGKP